MVTVVRFILFRLKYILDWIIMLIIIIVDGGHMHARHAAAAEVRGGPQPRRGRDSAHRPGPGHRRGGGDINIRQMSFPIQTV